MVAALALMVSLASVFGLWLVFHAASRDRIVGRSVDLSPRVTAVVPVGPSPGDLAVGEGAVWVAVPAAPPDQSQQQIVRIDPAMNEVVARITMDAYVGELAAGGGAIWASLIEGLEGTDADASFSLARIDPGTNEVVAMIPDVSGPVEFGEGAVWAVDRAGARAGPQGSSLLRIDPDANSISARIPLGVALWDVEVGDGFVWVLSFEPDPGDGDILKIDPRTNQVVARIDIPVPGLVYAPAVGEGSVWVAVCCSADRLALVRVDTETSRLVGEPIRVEGAAPFAVAAGHVWFFSERGTLVGLDVETMELDQRLSSSEGPSGVFPDPAAELDADRLVAWIANYEDSVTRVDLTAGTDPGGSLLEAEGTSIWLPGGWYGRADPLPGYVHPVFQAATFSLPPLTDIEATAASRAMAPDDVLIVLYEFTEICPPCTSESSGLPVLLTSEDFDHPADVPEYVPALGQVPPDHALARRIFDLGPRYFDLRVEFGHARPTRGGPGPGERGPLVARDRRVGAGAEPSLPVARAGDA